MPLEFTFLVDRPDAIPVISQWYFEEWGHLTPGDSLARTQLRVKDYMNRNEIPFILVATIENDMVGVAQLKHHEMAKIFPDKAHWLGGVYVPASRRGQGYGSQIIEQIVRLAPGYGVETLYLQTEDLDGGMYARLGWTPLAKVTNRGIDVLVMERRVSD